MKKVILFGLVMILLISFASAEYINEYTTKDGNNLIYNSKPIFMKNIDGEMKKYKNVTDFKIKDKKIEIDWYDKKITLRPFYIDDKGKEKPVPNDFETKYTTHDDYYKWTYIMANVPDMINFGVEFDGECEQINDYSIICGEQRLNFYDLIEAGYEINLTAEQLLITNLTACGIDYCIFDPTVEQNYESVIEDVYVYQNLPDTNYGSIDILDVGSYGSGKSAYSYVAINKTNISNNISNFGAWTSFFVYVKTRTLNTASVNYTITCYNDTFDENTLTWNNKGTEIINPVGFGENFVIAAGYNGINTTNCVLNSTGSDVFTFLIFNSTEDINNDFYTKESGGNEIYINATYSELACTESANCTSGYFCNATQGCQAQKAQGSDCLASELYNASDSVNLICAAANCQADICNGLPTYSTISLASSPYNLFIEDETFSCVVTGASDPDGDKYYIGYYWAVNSSAVFMHPFRVDDIYASLILYYPFQNNANDFSGNLNAGTPYGATWASAGLVDGAFNFDGTNDYINVTNGTLLNFNLTTNFSISLWAKTSDTGIHIIMDKRNETATPTPTYLYQSSGNVLYQFLNGSGTSMNLDSGDFGFNDGNWHNIVYTKNGLQNTLYINGVNTTSVSYAGAGTIYSTINYQIGASHGSGFFNGSIDEVAIWNKSLSVSEVSHLYYGALNKYINISNKTYMSAEPDTYANVSAGDSITCQAAIFDIYSGGNNSRNSNARIVQASTPYNASIYDEQTRELIDDRNITISVFNVSTNTTYTTANGTLIISSIPANFTIMYNSTGYHQREYYVKGTSGDIVLYMINDSTDVSTRIILSVKDQYADVIENITVELLRFYPTNNTYELVSMRTTNFDGQVVLYVELYDITYKIRYRNTAGTILKITEPSPFLTITPEDRVNTQDDVFQSWRTYEDIEYNLSFVNQTGTIFARMMYADVNNIAREACMKVERITTSEDFLICYNCTVAASATLTCTINHTLEGQWVATALVDTNTTGSWHPFPQVWYLYETDFTFGKEGAFFTAVMIGTLGMMGLASVTGSLMLAGMGVIGAFTFGLIYGFELGMIYWLVLLGLIIIFMVRAKGK